VTPSGLVENLYLGISEWPRYIPEGEATSSASVVKMSEVAEPVKCPCVHIEFVNEFLTS
jgi:hypothetical protein